MPQEVVHIMFWNYYQEQKHLGQIHISIYNQQFLFTFVIPYSPYTNDNDNNGRRHLIMNRTSELSNGIHVKKHGN